MFGVNQFGAPYFGQDSASGLISLVFRLINTTTRFVSGFKRTTRLEL